MRLARKEQRGTNPRDAASLPSILKRYLKDNARPTICKIDMARRRKSQGQSSISAYAKAQCSREARICELLPHCGAEAYSYCRFATHDFALLLAARPNVTQMRSTMDP